jgi:hypothetical protein
MEPVLEYVFEIRARIDADLHIGRGPDESLSFTPISGGSVSGPRLNGAVLAGGGDWAVERSGTAQHAMKTGTSASASTCSPDTRSTRHRNDQKERT